MKKTAEATDGRWTLRRVPAGLEQRYYDAGWWTDDTLGAMVVRSLRAKPEQTMSVWSRTGEWHGTYADVDREARQLVTLLRENGIEPGDVVAFQLPNSREAIVSFAALAMGGYVLVPIVHIYGRKEVEFILQQSGAVAYVSPVSWGHVEYADIVDRLSETSLRIHVVTGEIPPRSSPPSVRRVAWSQVGALPPATTLPEIDPRAPVVLAYTSGTTSDPKGVIHDHRSLLNEVSQMENWMSPDKPVLMGSPVTHATGMLGGVLGPLQIGSPVHLIDRWDPAHALEVMLEAGIGGGTGASVFLASLLDHPSFTPAHAAKTPRVGLGGSSVSPVLCERAAAHGIAVIRCYGSTEHPSSTGGRWEDPAELRHGTDGRPMPGVELRIRDEDGRDVGVGIPGEIWSRGPDLCLGYTDPDLNAAAFDEEGWFRTGDVGVLDESGCLTITDRVKDIIIRGGENVSASEVEDALQSLAGVAEVAVVAAPDERLGEHGCAVIRMSPGASRVDLPLVRSHLEARGLARPKWPEELRFVEDFPRTASGKIRKVDLRAWLRGEPQVRNQ